VLAFGWRGFSALCLIHLVVTVGMGLAWRSVIPATSAWIPVVWGRLVRDAVSEITPLSQFRGLATGARAVLLTGVPASVAVASTMADVTLEFVSKITYIAMGLVWLVRVRPASPVVLPLSIGLALTGLTALALCAAQWRGFGVFERFVRKVARGWASRLVAGATVLQGVLTETYARKGGLCAGALGQRE
jgi:hypothetical protein